MALYPRLLGLVEGRKLPLHKIMAALGEIERGKLTPAQVATAFDLDAGEQVELATLTARIVTPVESVSLGAFVTLTNVGAAYDTIPEARGLGMFEVQTAGITAVRLTVSMNKIGTGTQSWQLFNETDATEITVIDDAGASGNKTLTVTRAFVTALGAGLKRVRVRAKSTVAADDPLYYGASVAWTRAERLTAVELHEVLLLAEHDSGLYSTEATLKARLGT